MNLQSLVETYGYAAVFVGCFLEGETVLVLAAFAAHLGYLDLPAVLATAAVAGFCGDTSWYFAGRAFGGPLLARFPRLTAARPFVQAKLDRWGATLVFFVRFLVGMRIAAPVLIGASRTMPPWKFALPNAGGAVLWAVVVGGAGYVFGRIFTAWIARAHEYEAWAFAGLGLAVVAFLAWRRHAERQRERAGPPP